MRSVFLIFIISLSFSLSWGQDLSEDFKNWYIVNFNLRVSKKTTIKVSQLSSFDSKGYKMKFGQSSLSISNKLSKDWKIGGGYSFSLIKGTSSSSVYHRAHANLTHGFKLGKFKFSNTLQFEKYFPKLQKFGSRLVVTNKVSYRNNNWPLKLSPYVKNQFYYYKGGKEITYWLDEFELMESQELDEEESENSIEQSPNGWHRYRITGGVRMKISKPIALSIFFTKQIEFNTGLSPYREINVPNQSGTSIKRKFNNYSLLGLSLTYTLKTY